MKKCEVCNEKIPADELFVFRKLKICYDCWDKEIKNLKKDKKKK